MGSAEHQLTLETLDLCDSKTKYNDLLVEVQEQEIGASVNLGLEELLVVEPKKVISTDMDNPKSFDYYSQRLVAEARDKEMVVKQEQLEILRIRDIETGKSPPTEGYVWNDLDTTFKYTLQDIPVMITAGCDKDKIIPVQITRFVALDDCYGFINYPWTVKFRNRLCRIIRRYCRTVQPDLSFVPEVGEIIFVKIPYCNEIDALILYEYRTDSLKRNEWFNDSLRSDFDPISEDKDAHTWARAVFVSKFREDNPDDQCIAFIVELIDFGRKIPVIRRNVRKSVYRFLPFPAFSSRLSILAQHATQYTAGLQRKWKKILRVGATFRFTLVLDYEIFLVMNFHNPSEEQFDKIYNEMLADGEIDESKIPETMIPTTPPKIKNFHSQLLQIYETDEVSWKGGNDWIWKIKLPSQEKI